MTISNLEKVKELVENLDLILMNTTYTEADIERSDVGTFFLSKVGLKKVKESLAVADLALIDRKETTKICKQCAGEGTVLFVYPRLLSLPGNMLINCEACNGTGKELEQALIPLAEAIKKC